MKPSETQETSIAILTWQSHPNAKIDQRAIRRFPQGGTSNDGGVANIYDVCLPNGHKYTLEEAEPITCHNNIFLPEAAGVMKGCKGVKYILKDGNLPQHTAVNINIIMDC